MDFLCVDDRNLDVSLCLRMSDLLGDHLKGGDHRDVLVGHHMNDLLVDPNLDVMMDASRDHHTNVTDDRNDLNLDGNHGLHRNDLLVDHLKGVDHHDVLVDHRMNVKDDLNDLKMV